MIAQTTAGKLKPMPIYMGFLCPLTILVLGGELYLFQNRNSLCLIPRYVLVNMLFSQISKTAFHSTVELLGVCLNFWSSSILLCQKTYKSMRVLTFFGHDNTFFRHFLTICLRPNIKYSCPKIRQSGAKFFYILL